MRVTGDVLVDETAKSLRFHPLPARGGKLATCGSVMLVQGSGGFGTGTSPGLAPVRDCRMIMSPKFDGQSGNVWFAGNQGIFQVSERDFNDLVNGLITRVWPVIFGATRDCPDCRQVLIIVRTRCVLWTAGLFFSMLSGLAEVRLDYARLNYKPPSVFIERVTADNQTFADYPDFSMASITNGVAPPKLINSSDKSELRLPPGLQQVQFEFTALSFFAPENVQFRYMLEGLDKNWVDAGTLRMASYSHPPPGHYRFKVIACNNDGIWNKIGDTLPVTFEPFFWETLWFQFAVTLISFAALCGVVVLVVRRRHRLVVERLEHQRALELERNRIARDLHDDLGVGLTEIGLLGDLAGNSNELPQAGRERLQEITGRARSLAASLDEIVWAINPANDTSQSLVDYFFPFAQKILGHAGIRCRLEVTEPLPVGNLNAEERHEFFHAYKEALNNIIRHSGAKQVQITMSAADGKLAIHIADDGCGLDNTAGKGAHHGMAGMRERLLRLGGRCEINSRAGSGTTVTFIIPVQPET